MIAYFKNREQLFVMNKDGSESTKLCPDNDVLWIDWSPDSKWITFSRTTLGWREDIFVVRADGRGQCVNISNHPNDDYKPMWSIDGRRIAYASRDAIGNLWMKYIFLRREDEQKERDYWETEHEDSVDEDVAVEIDFADIEDRIHTVTKVLGWYNYVAQSPDGKQFALYSNNQESNDIWTVDWLGKKLKRVTNTNVRPRMFLVSKDKTKIVYLSGTGNLFSADIASAQSMPLSFNVEIGIDRYLEREQVFNEAWWALQDGFYDSDFHGVDWRAMYHKYKKRALHMRTRRDFHSVVRMMLGELNASHLGIYKSPDIEERTGALGIVYDPRYAGDGVKVAGVIRDSPIDKEEIGIEAGDIITHINGKRILRGENFYSYLRSTRGKDVMLTVRETQDERDVKVRPGTPWSIIRLIKDQWVQSNRDYVYEKSNDRLGYIYIASMGGRDLRTFEQDLYKEMDKEGLIIDIRYNGGGSIHDEILNILRRTAYMYSIERDGTKEFSSHFRWDKPTVLIINENCYSDAEIFPAAFKELGLGTVIGVPTFGAVIGTRDIRLLDGSGFRIPGTGWFTLTGENLENTPVEPDIRVENAPEMDGVSKDRQLTRALEILEEEINR
jgi:tricorn protease